MASNAQVIEGLWALGLPEDYLRQFSTKGKQGDLFTRLTGAGVTWDQLRAAIKMADTRVSSVDDVMNLLQAMGQPVEQIAAQAGELRKRPGIRPTGGGVWNFALGDLLDAIDRVGGPQLGINLRIKTGAPTPEGQWNPFRGDAPKAPTSAPAPTGTPAGPPPAAPSQPGGVPAGQFGVLGGPAAPGAPASVGDIQTVINNALAAREADVTLADVDDIIQRVYGFSAMALDIPEVRAVLNQAAAEDWDEARIKGAITATSWWRRTSDSERVWTALEKQDPATANRKVEQQYQTLKTQSAGKGFQVDDARLRQIAHLSQKFSWSPVQVQMALASEFRYDPAGEKQAFATNLKRLTKDYVIPLSDQAIESWGQQILAGTATEEDFTGYLSDQAKGMFPGMTAALDRGMSVRQFVDPYVQTAAQVLEIAPDEIDITDTKWLRAVNQIDPTTGDRAVMSLSDWESTLKLDKQYGYNKTKRAKQEAGAIGTRILEMFGAR